MDSTMNWEWAKTCSFHFRGTQSRAEKRGIYHTHSQAQGAAFDQIPLKTVHAGLSACGSRHSRWPSPAFIRKSCSEIEIAQPRKLIRVLAPFLSKNSSTSPYSIGPSLIGKSLPFQSNDPASPGSSTVLAPFPPYGMLPRRRPTMLRACGIFARRSLPVVPSSPLAVWAGCPSLLRSFKLWIKGTNVVEWNSRRVTRSTVPRCEVQVVMITPGYALAPLTGTPESANARENPEPPPCRGRGNKQGIASGIGADSKASLYSFYRAGLRTNNPAKGLKSSSPRGSLR
ncbi:hypothetical protein RDI58_001241 [Solanum bulbocastanum]|uniref:Uncharacterized protein n=1 Tax=Solanum bulbocastanum TaxID=147425 RepID=A0AAN8UDP0_SOLBU